MAAAPMAPPGPPGGYYGAPFIPSKRETAPGAVGALVCGILSLVMFGFLAGIPAVILGHSAKRKIAESGGQLEGHGMAVAGIVMGWISIGITIFVGLLLLVVVFAIFSL